MNKGIITAMNEKWATVLTEDCQLIKTRVQPDMAVGKEIYMDIKKKTQTAAVRPLRLKYVFLAASIVLVMAVALFVGQGLFKNPVYALLSVDVNPSIEMSLNRDLKVISVKAMNKDAEQILSDQNYEGLTWQVAVERWTEAMRLSNQVQVQNMLISAVIPEDAEKLRTELISMEGTVNKGVLAGIAVRVIYSSDDAVSKEAAKNGLSVGRQMLLNQAQVQNQNWDKTTIADAPLGDLIQSLLVKGEQNQTRLTERATESISSQSGDPTSTVAKETNQETNQQTMGQSSGSSQGNVSGSQEMNQGTIQQTNQYANGETNEAAQGSSSASQQTSQSMSKETLRETQQLSEQSSSSTTCEISQVQQTSQAKVTAGR